MTMTKTKSSPIDPANYIIPMNINGLNGRMLQLPSKTNKNREILVVYGLHSSLERMFGLAEIFSNYGDVTIPDLPGFGGMDNFYKIHEVPSLDNMADYLATVIKMRYRRKRVTIIGMSYGFLVATRMLQKYPELSKKVNLLVSLVGYAHHEDFRMEPFYMNSLKFVCWSGSYRIPGWIIGNVFFRDLPIRLCYTLVAKTHRKMKDADSEERKKRIDFEIKLWKMNHARTKARVISEMLRVDLCNKPVGLDVDHVAIANDHFFDNQVVEQHLSVIYKRVNVIYAEMEGHAPTVIADESAAAPFMPDKLRRLLSAKPK